MNANDANAESGCAVFDRLVGTQIGVGSVEIRFPILNPSFGLPAAVPPIEGALFYDIGLVWDENSTLKWNREAGDDPIRVRTPLQTIGASSPDELVRLRGGSPRLFDSAGAEGGQRTVDLQSRSHLLT